jgi:ribonucleoside-diphosphate reductase alpha chain
MRNSHLLSIAPTGTISLCAGNVSSGIEPVFQYKTKRVVQYSDGPKLETLNDYAVQNASVYGKEIQDVTVQEHLDVLSTVQKYVDSAVSKTVNVPVGTSWEDFKQVYIKAWESGCKGCSTFYLGGKRQGLFTAPDQDEKPGAACVYNPDTGERSCDE